MPHQSSDADRGTDRHSRLSIVTLLPVMMVSSGCSPGRVIARGGCWPADAFRNSRPLLALVIQEADVWRLLRAMGE